MIDKIAGYAMIVGSILAIFLANMPVVETIIGGVTASQLQWMAANAFWIMPAGFFLINWRAYPVIPLTIITIIGIIVLFILLNLGAWIS